MEEKQVCETEDLAKEEAVERDSMERDPREREVDIFDIIPSEAVGDANRLGYEFLAERGYDALGAWANAEKHAALEAELKARGEELRYSGAYDLDDKGRLKAILIWYELYDSSNMCLARSKGLKLVPTESEVSSDICPSDK